MIHGTGAEEQIERLTVLTQKTLKHFANELKLNPALVREVMDGYVGEAHIAKRRGSCGK
jgi:hypothetical protein